MIFLTNKCIYIILLHLVEVEVTANTIFSQRKEDCLPNAFLLVV